MAQKDTTMKPILSLVGNLQQQNSTNNQSEESTQNSNVKDSQTPSPLTDTAILFIWGKMTAIYGDQWISRRGQSYDVNGNISPTAKEWQTSLAGFTPQQIKAGFKAMDKKLDIWPPNLYQFKTYCLSLELEGVPSVDEVYAILAYNKNKEGSIKDRYQHPLVFYISQDSKFDMQTVRGESVKIAITAITSVYNRLILEGWPDWEPEHLIDHKLLEKKLTDDEKTMKLEQRKKGFASLRDQIRLR
jgi:hypothetical protein